MWLPLLVLAVPVTGSLSHGGATSAQWLLSAALLLPLLGRRHHPAAVLAVQLVAAVLQLLDGSLLAADLAMLVTVHSVALHRPRRQARYAAGAVELYALTAAAFLQPGDDGRLASALFSSGLVAAAYFSGAGAQDRHAYLAGLVDRAERLEREQEQSAQLAVQTERTRIARELHDVVAHSLAVMITLSDAARAAGVGTPAAQHASEQVSATGREAMAQMRRLLGVLRDDAGPAPLVPQPGVEQLDDLVETVRAAGLPVQLRTTGSPQPTASGLATTVYRVVQEGLTNALRHADCPTRVTVSITWREDELEVCVDDDGRPRVDDGPSGHGLVGMRERVGLFDGTLEAGPTATGWRVRACIPLLPAVAR